MTGICTCGKTRQPEEIKEFFLESVSRSEDPDACWLWLGCLNDQGYGTFQGRIAHRVAWSLWCGALDSGRHLHHACRVKSCVNVAHLVPMTSSEHSKEHARLRREGISPPRQAFDSIDSIVDVESMVIEPSEWPEEAMARLQSAINGVAARKRIPAALARPEIQEPRRSAEKEKLVPHHRRIDETPWFPVSAVAGLLAEFVVESRLKERKYL